MAKADPHRKLTPRTIQVMKSFLCHYGNIKAVEAECYITESTIKTHLNNVMAHTRQHNRLGLAAYFLSHGHITLDEFTKNCK